MSKGFAYISAGPTLHVVDDQATAQQYSINGKIEEIDFDHDHGYPEEFVNGYERQITVDIQADGSLKETEGLPIPDSIISLIDRLK